MNISVDFPRNPEEHVLTVTYFCLFFCKKHNLICNYRACEYFGCVWTVHTFWQPDIWPLAGPYTCNCKGSSWYLHTGTVTDLPVATFYISLSSNIILFFFLFFQVGPICGFQTWTNWGVFDEFVFIFISLCKLPYANMSENIIPHGFHIFLE